MPVNASSKEISKIHETITDGEIIRRLPGHSFKWEWRNGTYYYLLSKPGNPDTVTVGKIMPRGGSRYEAVGKHGLNHSDYFSELLAAMKWVESTV